MFNSFRRLFCPYPLIGGVTGKASNRTIKTFVRTGPALSAHYRELVVLATQPEEHFGRIVAISSRRPRRRAIEELIVRGSQIKVRFNYPIPDR